MVNDLMYLQRRNKVVIPINNNNNNVSKSYIATAMKNLESYGYTFSENLVLALQCVNENDFIDWYNNLKSSIISLVGKKGIMIPMYPNFPEQVMEASEVELYFNAIIHYMSLGKLLPDYEVKERFPLIDNPSLTVIDLGDKDDFNSIFKNLLSSKVSLSESDKEDITWFVNNVDFKSLLPNTIPHKENLSFITMLLWDKASMREVLVPLYKTATDVLRLAVALSGGDVSLKDAPWFKSFKRSERRVLLSMLENANNIEEDMARYKNIWIRLGEKLHPGEYKSFVKVNEAFNKLRNNIKIETFRSKLEKAFKDSDLDAVLNLLSKRPGEFARSLDRILRLTVSDNRVTSLNEGLKVVKAFELVSKEVSTPVLLQVREYFKKRAEGTLDTRVFFPKGSMAKAYGIENNLTQIDTTVCLEVVKVCGKALIELYSEKEVLGKVFVDEGLSKYIVPAAQRSASKSLKSVARGSRFTINNKAKVLRGFVYWREPENCRTDLDLSAVFYDENLSVLDTVAYFNLKSDEYKCCHSGDITSAPNGASEYIDMDLEDLKSKGVRYVSLVVNSFTETPFCDLPECFVGFMEREDIKSGEIYEPKTVINKSDITSSSEQVLPIIIDIEAMEVVWADLVVSNAVSVNNVHRNKPRLIYALKAMLNAVKPNMYDLAMLNVLARGELVSSKEEADVVFSVTEGVTPYDVDVIMGEYI